MALKESEGHTRPAAVGNLATTCHEGRAYPRSGAIGQRANEEHRWSQPTSVISMGVIDEKSFTRECITRCFQALGDRFDIVPFATCDQFLQSMKNPESTKNPDLVLYHVHEDAYNSQKLLSVKKLLNIVPVIILSDIENNSDTLIEMFESGARGFIPTVNTTFEQVVEIIRFVKVGGIFAPISILSLRRTKSQSATARPVSNDQFTPSELAILDRLKLGKANKIIAHELRVSESTVKVHIGRIMRKLKVTNRTQIVCRAYALTLDFSVSTATATGTSTATCTERVIG